MRNTRSKFAVAAMAVGALFVAGCSGSSESDSAAAPSDSETSSASSSAATVDMPEEFSGEWLIPFTANFPPMSFGTGEEPGGLQPLLVLGLVEQLGKQATLEPTAFANQLVGLDQGKYVLVPGVTPNAERAKRYDFTTFAKDSYTFAAAEGVDLGDSMEDICGRQVAVQAGDVSISELERFSGECESAGKEPIVINSYPDIPSALLAVRSNREDAVASTTSNLTYLVEQDSAGAIELSGPTFKESPLTFATLKGNGLAEVLKDGIDAMIAEGTYAEILEEAGLSASAITESVVNPPL
ncbi:ABC-type amino acid transport substrate-binding protein [Rhodococcus rhodochrous J38]|uniref:transporter substrate-binding domain-containing protein n=1 Tax=Rhodococcus rhodochrous TaxID=1829 RepID=UPI0011A18EF8|nr:transporter substrate-binding domain-containing protein [Rhodococcus rhodochrous]TWH41969.1 ABC-type amino acid transport substrate-binding protein [Rhodococcus rhodochrous J38]